MFSASLMELLFCPKSFFFHTKKAGDMFSKKDYLQFFDFRREMRKGDKCHFATLFIFG